MLASSSTSTPVRSPRVCAVPPALLHAQPAPSTRVQPPLRAEPAHGSVADRARMAQRLLAFGAW